MREIREFRVESAGEVETILVAAFGGGGEARLVRALRADGAMALERVAVEDGVVVGHIAFSPLMTAPATLRLAGLAPVAVAPDRQGQGIGGALIRDGLARCAAAGFAAVALLGDPAYYRHFGFTRRAAFPLHSIYSGPAWQALELSEGALAGGPWTVRHPAAFAALD